MHDCLQTQDGLIDLIFDETDPATRSRLLAEVERCAACAAEYQSFAATLAACDGASAALAPAEGYWPQYHAALTRRLRGAARDAERTHAPTSTPFWKRLLTTSIRVPAPLAAAAVLLLVIMSVFALVARPAPEPVMIAAPYTGQPEAAPEIKFIEVPVVQEKIVTQIIYVPRRSDRVRSDAARENLAGIGRQNALPSPLAGTPPARANLSGFKPAGEVNLRIIKGSVEHER